MHVLGWQVLPEYPTLHALHVMLVTQLAWLLESQLGMHKFGVHVSDEYPTLHLEQKTDERQFDCTVELHCAMQGTAAVTTKAPIESDLADM